MTLARLIEAVEAGLATGGPADALVVPKEQSDLIASVLGDDDELWSDFVEAHDGSLDAAKRLHDALLPGWIWGITSRDDQLGIPAAFVANPDDPDEGYEAHCADPARAMLLAELKAYAAILRAMEGRE